MASPAISEPPLSNQWWIRELTSSERSAFVATFGGWMLDGMDVMVYSLVLPTLLTTWHISRGQAGLLSTSTLLLSSLGGWFVGILADRFGRVRVLKLTIFWFAFFTFLSGFTQSFPQLLAARGLQGLGFGGEWAVGAALMGETIRARYRGRAVGTLQSRWAVGWGISVVLFTIIFSSLPAAHLTDAIGRKCTLILFAGCAFIAIIFYAAFPISNHLMLVLGFPLGFFPSGSFSPMGTYFGELFPTSMRASGAGFAYNSGRGAGALFPTLVGYLSGHTSLGLAISLFGSGAYLLMVFGVLFLPETRGRELEG
jgi:MFS family permease